MHKALHKLINITKKEIYDLDPESTSYVTPVVCGFEAELIAQAFLVYGRKDFTLKMFCKNNVITLHKAT